MKSFESKCYVYHAPGDVRVETQEIRCSPTDIVVKVDVCGRCGTDRRIYAKGHTRVRTPAVLGHELVGHVAAVGDRVSELRSGIGYLAGQTLSDEQAIFKEGERVTVQGRIAHHRQGLMLMKDPIQNLTFYIPGAYAHYMKLPAEFVQSGAILRVPDHVSDEEAALVEPAGCALESIFATPHAVGVDHEGRHVCRSGIREEGRTLVIGSGTLAMIYAVLARLDGAGEVTLLVRSKTKADLIMSVLGNWPVFKIAPDYADLPLPEKIQLEARLEQEFAELTNGQLFDDVVLACPSLDAQRLLFRLLNPYGYAVAACFGGLQENSEEAAVDLLHYRIGKAIGTSGCSTRTMTTVLQWLSEGKLSLAGFTCPHRYTLEDDPGEFLTTTADGRKPMLHPWG